MGVIELNGIFKAKNKTAAQWASENPILRDGEFGHEKDTHKSKIGDGVNHWNDLEYANKAYPADIKMTDWAKMLESAYSPITNTDTLLAALQKLQVLVDNGDAYLFRCYGTNSTMSGVAFGSSNGLRGLRAICYNSWVNKILVCAGEITLPAFIRMSETEQAAWLGEHTEHSMPVEDIQLGTNIANGSHEDWVATKLNASGFDAVNSMIYLDPTLIRGKQITYRVELKGEDAQASSLGFEIKVHFTDNTDQWIARYSAGDIPERGTFEKAYTFSSQIQDKEIEYARLYPVFRSLDGGEVSGKLYARHEFVGVGNTLPSTWSPSVADQKKYTDETVGEAVNGLFVEITDFANPPVNKNGQSFFFYANDASNIPNNNDGAVSFAGIAIPHPSYSSGVFELSYYIMIDTQKFRLYTGLADYLTHTVTWSDGTISRLGGAIQVTAFTEGALSALLYNYKPGDFIPFYTGNVTASTDNQFPESGIFNGFISMGSNEGDYFQIFAFRSGSTKAYLGACIGSTTQWTALGGGGDMEKISNWTNTDISYMPSICPTDEHVILNLTRATKTTDILRIDLIKRDDNSHYQVLSPVVHVAAMNAISQDGYDVVLDERYINSVNGDFSKLSFENGSSILNTSTLKLYINKGGSVPDDNYYIVGIYNISGK